MRGKLRLDVPFNAALELLTSKDGDVSQEIFGERFGRRGLNWSVDQLDLDSLRLDNISLSPLDLDGEGPLTKRSSEGLKKKLERDERKVLKKCGSRKLSIPDAAVEIMRTPSEKPTVASEVMEALRFAVGKGEDPEEDRKKLYKAILVPAEGRRRSATGAGSRGSIRSAADPRRGSKRGSKAASRRGSAASASRPEEEPCETRTSIVSVFSEASSAKPRQGSRHSSKKAAQMMTLSAPVRGYKRMPRRLPRSPSREHRSEAWLARDTGLPLSVLQQSLAFFKKHVPEYDGQNLFEVKFDMKNFTKVLCEMACVDSVEQLDRRFVSEAFRQADFDKNGGIDCVEFVMWFSAFGFSQYFCVTKEDLPQRDLARKLGVDYIELERYKHAFDKYDEDGSGAIDIEEFECLLNDLLKVPSGQNLSAERIGALWRDADRGGEGELNLEAFCDFFKRHFDNEQPENSISDYYRSIRRIPTMM